MIERHIAAIKSGTDSDRYDAVLTVVQSVKKGWYATLLASEIRVNAIIPAYILDAIAFAVKDVISPKILWKMVKYSFDAYTDLDSDYDDMKKEFAEAVTLDQKHNLISKFCDEFPKDMVSEFIVKVGG